MNSKRQSLHRRFFAPLTLILALLLVAPGVAPAVTATEVLPVRETARVDQPDAGTTAVAGLTAGERATILDLIRQAEYQFAWQVSDGEWAYRAPNRANGLSLALAADGFHAARYREGEPLWEFGLSLAAYGTPFDSAQGAQIFPTAIAEGDLVGDRERVEYHWSRDVVEWYTNSADGVEHGLTLAAPPAGADGSTVELAFALRGSLAPELDGDGRMLRLKDAGGRTVLHYDQLAVYDATGRSLPAYFSLSSGGEAKSLHITIDATGAAYPLTVDPLIHAQEKKLTSSDAAEGDQFGYSVAVSGDTVIVGAYLEDGAGTDRGAAYIFERNKLGTDYWGEVRKLQITNPENEAHFGYSVAISGDTAVVGAPLENNAGAGNCVAGTNCGAAYVFERNKNGADNWGQVQRLTAGYNARLYALFGYSVAISNDSVVVGAPYAPDPGEAYLFERNQGGADNWGKVMKVAPLETIVPYGLYGSSVAISGDTLVVGAMGTDDGGTERGTAFIFARNHGGSPDSWYQVTRLAASGTGEDGDQFGYSVAISGDTLVVGAKKHDVASTDAGAAYVFERNQGGPADNWGQVTILLASDAEDDDHFGESVSISNDTIVVGASYEDGAGAGRGAAYVFERNQGGIADNWGQVTKLTAADTADSDYFGYSVAISGDTVIVGAPREDGATPSGNLGAAYIFGVGDGQWQQVDIAHASDAEAEDRFGYSVAISGDTAVVGADGEDGGGTDMGAAYILERNQDGADSWGEVKKLFGWDSTNYNWFGWSVAISGDTVVVGAPGEDSAGNTSGAAYVFERNKGLSADYWGQVTKLAASDPGSYDEFGFSVAISDDTIVVGAPWEEGSVGADRGSAYIFTRNQGGADNWGQAKKLLASDAQSYAYFGRSVALSDDTIVVGAFRAGSSDSQRGAAYVFERNQGGIADNWGQVTKLTASDATDDDRFGNAVAISGDTLVVGAYWEDGWMMDNRGAAYVFARNKSGADKWGEVKKLLASDMVAGDEFGQSVAISVDTIVVGAHLADAGGDERGAAYVYERNTGGGDNWGQVVKLTASDGADNDNFGYSVAISGDTVVVGAYLEDGRMTGNRGAAYVFTWQQLHRTYLPLVANNN
jgi:hypothetical protein